VADTGLPWELPYPLPTDLVRDGADAIKDLAEAVADGLDAAGGLVAVKHALFTGTQTASLNADEMVAVTDVEITHALADASNKLIIHAYMGTVGHSLLTANVGLAVTDGTTRIGIGDAAGNRNRVGAGGRTSASGSILTVTNLAQTFVYEPGDTANHTYFLRAVSLGVGTVFINRTEQDNDSSAARPRSASGLVIQEVKV
jgi:hypothetical protein